MRTYKATPHVHGGSGGRRTEAATSELVDAHMHIWNPHRLDYQWLRGQPALNRPFTPPDLDTEGHDLSGAVIVEAGCRADQTVNEVVWIEEMSTRWPTIKAVVAHLPVELGQGTTSYLQALAEHVIVKGVRRNLETEKTGFALADDFVQGIKRVAERGYTFDLCIRHDQLAEVTELVSLVPSAAFVLDHLGKPPVATRSFVPWRDRISVLAGFPNAYCKISGLTTEAASAWSADDLLPYLRHVIDAFGPERCLFGGDWPVATLATTYGGWLDVVRRATDELRASDRRAIMAGNAKRVYGLAM